jgi:energy-coupling factor transporter ATP-binding protein EcfA2
MHLRRLLVKNFRSWKDAEFDIGKMHAILGANNAGKSSLLRALDLLFNPSTRALSEESFWNSDTSQRIWVEAVFKDLSTAEKETLRAYLKPDGSFHMARSVSATGVDGGGDSDEESGKFKISQHYCQPMPSVAWLRDGEINGNVITEWWRDRDHLIVDGLNFNEFLASSTKPTVGTWKEKAKEFLEQNHDSLTMEDAWQANPTGYANVLKGVLPLFVLIPAVRDVSDESKVTKTNPFGRLLYAILDTVTAERRQEIERMLRSVANQFNRGGGDERVELIAKTETRINELLAEVFLNCDLEIEFQTPTLEVMFSSPRIFVNDGFRNIVENKGHGLQRAIIFSILRRYAEHMTTDGTERKRTLILAVEEPELYMHPLAQRTIRKMFRGIADAGDQVIFSTHSALLVDVTYFDEIIRVESRPVATEEQSTSVQSSARQLTMARMIEDLVARVPRLRGQVNERSMRELYAHAYNPTRNEGFFAKSVILVEGATEAYSLPIYAEALASPLDVNNIAVVECGGKGPMDRLYRIFNELGIPCYLVFDYDKSNSDSEIKRKSKELISLGGDRSPGRAPRCRRVRPSRRWSHASPAGASRAGAG